MRRTILRRVIFTRQLVVTAAAAASLASGSVDVHARPGRSGVPILDIKSSCAAGQAGATGEDAAIGYRSCLKDEMKAKSDVAKLWPKLKQADRAACVEEASTPSPSYVDLLTCLQADLDPLLPWGRS